MTEIFEEVIGDDMKLEGRGQEMRDGWTKNGAHFDGALASYYYSIKRKINKIYRTHFHI